MAKIRQLVSTTQSSNRRAYQKRAKAKREASLIRRQIISDMRVHRNELIREAKAREKEEKRRAKAALGPANCFTREKRSVEKRPVEKISRLKAIFHCYCPNCKNDSVELTFNNHRLPEKALIIPGWRFCTVCKLPWKYSYPNSIPDVDFDESYRVMEKFGLKIPNWLTRSMSVS